MTAFARSSEASCSPATTDPTMFPRCLDSLTTTRCIRPMHPPYTPSQSPLLLPQSHKSHHQFPVPSPSYPPSPPSQSHQSPVHLQPPFQSHQSPVPLLLPSQSHQSPVPLPRLPSPTSIQYSSMLPYTQPQSPMLHPSPQSHHQTPVPLPSQVYQPPSPTSSLPTAPKHPKA